MGFYQLKKEQFIKAPKQEVWDFISSPKNLKHITPDYMGFDIITPDIPEKMYEGMIIAYKVTPVLGIKTTWVTEITTVKENDYFVDKQRVGPYSLWHHQHALRSENGGTLMTDIVSYKPPLGILGNLANRWMIRSKLEEIFTYRKEAIDNLF